jgi:hypothetical protein
MSKKVWLNWRIHSGKTLLDFALDLALKEDLQTVFTAQLLNSDAQAVGQLLDDPHSLVSLSDAGARLTFFNVQRWFWLAPLGSLGQRLRPDDRRDPSGSQTHCATRQSAGLERPRSLERAAMPPIWCCSTPKPLGVAQSTACLIYQVGQRGLNTLATGVHGVWVNGQLIADHNGLHDTSELAGQLLTEFT